MAIIFKYVFSWKRSNFILIYILFKCISLYQTENSGNTYCLMVKWHWPITSISLTDICYQASMLQYVCCQMLSDISGHTCKKKCKYLRITLENYIWLKENQHCDIDGLPPTRIKCPDKKSANDIANHTQHLTHQRSTWFVAIYLLQKSSHFGPLYAIALFWSLMKSISKLEQVQQYNKCFKSDEVQEKETSIAN